MSISVRIGFLIWANPGLSFVYFHPFIIPISINISKQIEEGINGVLRIQTHGSRTVGADETTELSRPPLFRE